MDRRVEKEVVLEHGIVDYRLYGRLQGRASLLCRCWQGKMPVPTRG
ncbi:MAG: hypothetical protein JRH07_00615 [Deltaproteobacteria bacterium]|nr:hypothetical protein [Deltaproteobacteria bacterium]MBW2120335.1 hypothetical protein [Deltaproteobacteria bacterium]